MSNGVKVLCGSWSGGLNCNYFCCWQGVVFVKFWISFTTPNCSGYCHCCCCPPITSTTSHPPYLTTSLPHYLITSLPHYLNTSPPQCLFTCGTQYTLVSPWQLWQCRFMHASECVCVWGGGGCRGETLCGPLNWTSLNMESARFRAWLFNHFQGWLLIWIHVEVHPLVRWSKAVSLWGSSCRSEAIVNHSVWQCYC